MNCRFGCRIELTDLGCAAALVLVQAEARLVDACVDFLLLVEVVDRPALVVAPRPNVLHTFRRG